MFEKEILYDKYSDLRINRIHMYPNVAGTALYYDATLEHEVPYDEIVNATRMGFIAIVSSGSVYSPSKYTLTAESISIYCDDSITVVVPAPAPATEEETTEPEGGDTNSNTEPEGGDTNSSTEPEGGNTDPNTEPETP